MTDIKSKILIGVNEKTFILRCRHQLMFVVVITSTCFQDLYFQPIYLSNNFFAVFSAFIFCVFILLAVFCSVKIIVCLLNPLHIPPDPT